MFLRETINFILKTIPKYFPRQDFNEYIIIQTEREYFYKTNTEVSYKVCVCEVN